MRKKWFEFSDEDKKRIEKLLEGYDLAKIENFINTIEGEINFVNSLSSKRGRIYELTQAIDQFKNTIEELDGLMDRISFMPIKYSADFRIDGAVYLRRQASVPKCIEEVERPLKGLIKILEETLEEEKEYLNIFLINKKGEKFSPVILTWIADSYKKLIDPPHPVKGPFHQIIDIVLGDIKDRTRSIRRALRSIK